MEIVPTILKLCSRFIMNIIVNLLLLPIITIIVTPFILFLGLFDFHDYFKAVGRHYRSVWKWWIDTMPSSAVDWPGK